MMSKEIRDTLVICFVILSFSVVVSFLKNKGQTVGEIGNDHFIENHSEIKPDSDFILASYNDIDLRHQVTISQGIKKIDSIKYYMNHHQKDDAYRCVVWFNHNWFPLEKRQRDTMYRLLKQIVVK